MKGDVSKVKKILLITIAVLSALIYSGCMSSGGGIAPSTVPITGNDSYTVVKEDVYGTDWSVSVLGIPLIPCSAYTAMKDAINMNGADALINVTAENKYIYLFFVNFQTMLVRGDAIKFQRGGEW